jgi:hypothetical protein
MVVLNRGYIGRWLVAKRYGGITFKVVLKGKEPRRQIHHNKPSDGNKHKGKLMNLEFK